jgi:hypothetical protein
MLRHAASLAALAVFPALLLASSPAFAGELRTVDPCAGPGAAAAPSVGFTAPPGPCAGAPAVPTDTLRAERNRATLRLRVGGIGHGILTGPAGTLTVPTAIGAQGGRGFIAGGWQSRTRYTESADAGAVVGLGFGSRRTGAAEVALTTYSTARGVPFETGGVNLKLHRALSRYTAVAAGMENAFTWGGSDAERSPYGVVTQVLPLRPDPRALLGAAVLTVGIGGGRFRPEPDAAASGTLSASSDPARSVVPLTGTKLVTEPGDSGDRFPIGVFVAGGIRVAEPLSLIADWNGQNLNAGASVRVSRSLPLTITAGAVDLTGAAGDGVRFIAAFGYAVGLPWRF